MKIPGRWVGFTAAAALAVSVPLLVTHAAGASTQLLSQSKPVTSSSVENSALGPGNAVDGNTGTRWASAEGGDPQWIRVDLGGSQTISRVVLRWETAFGKAYRVETSVDGKAWTGIYSTTSGNGGKDNLTGLSGQGRYLRVYGTARGTEWGYSLWELQVYGPGTAVPAPTSSSPVVGSPATAPPRTTTAAPTSAATTPVTSLPAATTAPRTSAATTPATPATLTAPVTSAPTSTGSDLTDPHKKDIAMQLVSSAENSSLNWRAQFSYLEDIGDGRGYTGGIIGFCSGTDDMLQLVEHYTALSPGNVLAAYLPALRAVDGTDSHAGLDPGFPAAWRSAAADPVFQQAQEDERDSVYFNPAVQQAKKDGLRALGQFIYYDAIVMHGPGDTADSFGGIRKAALAKAKSPAQGGDEVTYLNAFLDARVAAMKTEEAHSDTSRVDTEQRAFLNAGNLPLSPPLTWKVYGDPYTIPA